MGGQHRVYLNPNLNPANIFDEDEESDSLAERSSKSKSFWIGGELSSDVGRRQLKNLFGTAFFDYPKSVNFIANAIYMGADEDCIVLDFFSGSATTAHSVMQLNAEDKGNRRFILIQLPEKCSEESEAYKAGYETICDIGEERIRLAGKKIKEDHSENNNVDVGFRVFKVDSSNMKDVYYKPADYDQGQIDLFAENIKEDRIPEDLLSQVHIVGVI